VTELIDAHVERRMDNSRQLWGLMSFSLWVEQIAQSSPEARSGQATAAPSANA
jgi:hypothetical protein